MQAFEIELQKECESFPHEFQQIVDNAFIADSVLQDARKTEPVRLRQDVHPLGLHPQRSEQDVLDIQLQSDDISFHAKNVFDMDIYLNELLARGHQMDESFQREMSTAFKECAGCEFQSGYVKTYNRCKKKVQYEYGYEAYPKTAFVIDILRCRATFDHVANLCKGLHSFFQFLSSPSNQSKFQIVRVKNGFACDHRAHTPNHNTYTAKDEGKEEEKQSDSFRQRRIRVAYKAININLLYIENNENIVTEVQLVLDSVNRFHQKTLPFFRILQQESLHNDALLYLQHMSFDLQLQASYFNPRDLADLMLFQSTSFRHSQFIRSFKDSEDKNFLCQLAQNQDVRFHSLKALLRNTNTFIPDDVVQTQLTQPCEKGAFPLMFALWKQTSISSVLLFVPSDAGAAQTIWHSLDH
ncbi:hypothetical protein RFI_20384, partial [Reticulomyxa filosa]